MQHHQYPIRTQPDESEYLERHRTRLPTIVASSSPESHGSDGLFAQRAGPSLRPFHPIPDTGQVSPAETNLLAHDYYNAGSGVAGVSHVDALGQVIVPNPKRAYRQRRKDPSCDACRERKVKCDATETTSCTECSSRNVRCQFTKDSNRRMSSIKQVQDLERQLVEARTQLDLIRASENVAEQRAQRAPPFLDPEIQDISRSPRRMLKARTPHDLSVVRAQLADVGRGVLRPPISPLVPDEPDHCKLPLSILPPRNIAQHCLDIYLQSVHKRCPIVNWPQFCERFWSLYAGEATSDVSQEVITMSFAILGLGAYSSPDIRVRGESEGFVQVAFQNMNFWNNRFGANQGPVSLLLSIYMLEANMRSNSLIWLGCATRIAQDRGLHIQGGYWSAIDGEMRKRIWYSLYVCDRLVAMELGRPMLIADEDCDTEYPQLLEEEEYIADVFHPQRPTLLLASVHVCRLIAPLAQLCRSLCITIDARRRFEVHMNKCMNLFPVSLQLGATDPLDPMNMAPILHFQNVRLLLHRHNISPANSLEQRSASIDACVQIAQDTATVVSRCFLFLDREGSAEARLRISATALICTHLWRCMLFLAFRQHWVPFDVLLRYVAAVGDSRPVNVSCGRHLSLFLNALVEKREANDTKNLEEDEELIVLLSADLQAGTNSWVWGNTETGTLLSRRQRHSRLVPDSSSSSSPSPQISLDSNVSKQEIEQWGGWQSVHEAARRLSDDSNQKAVPPQLPNYGRIVPDYQQGASQPEPGRCTNTARARMTIASITDL